MLLYPATFSFWIIRLDGTNIIPGEIAIFITTFVFVMAVLIFEKGNGDVALSY